VCREYNMEQEKLIAKEKEKPMFLRATDLMLIVERKGCHVRGKYALILLQQGLRVQQKTKHMSILRLALEVIAESVTLHVMVLQSSKIF